MVRKALFDILGDISGLSFLELFAGSGAVGLEAASRGAEKVVLVERDPACLKAIEENIRVFKCDKCVVLAKDCLQAVKQLCAQKKQFDIIFLDPPYRQGISKNILQILDACDILAGNGFVVIEHSSGEALPEAFDNLTLIQQRSYGKTILSFYSNLSH
ncbi:MAG: 16S rRNA (guanine(966)-N(2))-methyltransferase RsmD [Candidatus Omnitrophica bacterium]|nr:16S rRNA (guanine(966)-N(2))-methyltransferase RsmD [Candidatus Omnitrophota bacterium]